MYWSALHRFSSWHRMCRLLMVLQVEIWLDPSDGVVPSPVARLRYELRQGLGLITRQECCGVVCRRPDFSRASCN